MLLRQSAAGLAALSAGGSVAEAMLEQMLIQHGQRPSPAEARSWQRSLPLLANDLVQAGLGDVEVLVEYRLPLTSRRVDAILAGRHPRTGAASYVVVELKQWSGAELFEGDPDTLIISGGPGTGKSVIALSLLGELARQGRSVLHATGSRSC
jgi:uncharacterized protein